MVVDNTVNIGFCFGPRLGLKTEVWAQAEQFYPPFFLLFGGRELMRKEVKIGGEKKAADLRLIILCP